MAKNLQVITNLAIKEALKSKMRYKHGSVIFNNQGILGSGYSWSRFKPNQEQKVLSIHSERDALKGIPVRYLRGAFMLNVRVTKIGLLTCSKPCVGCQKLLKRKGLLKIYYYEADRTRHILEL